MAARDCASGLDSGGSGGPLVRPAGGKPYDPRTRALLEGPIAATLVRLAAPNMLVMLAQASVGLIETYFVGKLGTAERGHRSHAGTPS